METNELLDDQSHDLSLDGVAKEHLRTAAQWSKIIAIIGFVFLGFAVLTVLFLLFTGFFATILSSTISFFGLLVYPAILGLVIYINLCLYRFGARAKMALDTNSSSALNAALSNLGTYFKINGILVIAVIALYFLMFIIIGTAGMAGAF